MIRFRWVALGGALMFLAGAAGYSFAEWSERPPGAGSVDVGFLRDMAAHHEQAIRMASVELAGGSEPRVEVFAREILHVQGFETGLMHRVLDEWGYRLEDRPEVAMAWMAMPVPVAEMPGMASEAELDRLVEVSGRDRDALFVRLMQDHHRGGVHMAEYAARRASDPYVRELAARMARNQRIEVMEMEQAREATGLSTDPPGWEPAAIPSAHDTHG